MLTLNLPFSGSNSFQPGLDDELELASELCPQPEAKSSKVNAEQASANLIAQNSKRFRERNAETEAQSLSTGRRVQDEPNGKAARRRHRRRRVIEV
jgi:hypothetical protein